MRSDGILFNQYARYIFGVEQPLLIIALLQACVFIGGNRPGTLVHEVNENPRRRAGLNRLADIPDVHGKGRLFNIRGGSPFRDPANIAAVGFAGGIEGYFARDGEEGCAGGNPRPDAYGRGFIGHHDLGQMNLIFVFGKARHDRGLHFFDE